MNFFEHQDRARQRTTLLVFLFGVAVVLLVFTIYLAIATALMWSSRPGHAAIDPDPYGTEGVWLGGWFPWSGSLFVVVSVAILAVIAGGSLYKTADLSSGGRRVAESLGGRLIAANTRDLHQRRVLNVVEEMALASGTPVPPVYLLPQEQGINAFAAGFSPSDAVVGVTRGCIENLSRDELQGVVAHEFSHILNGDMRLNLRLIGLLHGILLIALIGSVLMRMSSASRNQRSNNRNSGNFLPLLGVILYVLGYIGVFFGHLIKSSVSRQREFLADASAVQFTRNPLGIAGALAQILQSVQGSRLQTPKAEEASHLLFSNGLTESWAAAFSTHPPLQKRIAQIDPSFSIPQYLARWGGKAKATGAGKRQRRTASRPPVGTAAATGAVAGFAADADVAVAAAPAAMPAEAVGSAADRFIQALGQPTDAHWQQAAAWRRHLPADLLDQLRTPVGAVAVTYCLFLDADPEQRERQGEYLQRHALPAALAEAQRLWPVVRPILPDGRLGLLELALPLLKQLSPQQYATLRQNLRSLVEMDRLVTVNEYALHTLIRLHLDRHFGRARTPSIRYKTLTSAGQAAHGLLSIVARAGQRAPVAPSQPSAATPQATELTTEAAVASAYQRAWRTMADDAVPPPMLPADECTAQRLDSALRHLLAASPAVKQQVLTACATSIATDRQITIAEAELLRLVADHLDCPAPPLLSLGGA